MVIKDIKKLKKLIKKKWKIKDIEINLNERIIDLALRIAMKSENCNEKEAYNKWIIAPNLHLPGWISFDLIDSYNKKLKANNTITELIND